MIGSGKNIPSANLLFENHPEEPVQKKKPPLSVRLDRLKPRSVLADNNLFFFYQEMIRCEVSHHARNY